MSFAGDVNVSLSCDLKRVTRERYEGMILRIYIGSEQFDVTPNQPMKVGDAWRNAASLQPSDWLTTLTKVQRTVHMPCWGHGFSIGSFSRLWRGLLHHEDNLTRGNDGAEHIDVSPAVLQMMRSSFFHLDAHMRKEGEYEPVPVTAVGAMPFSGYMFSLDAADGSYGLAEACIVTR